MVKKVVKKPIKKVGKSKPVRKTSSARGVPSKDQVVAVLKQCMDPELGLDIFTLGLIYDIQSSKSGVDIKMTFTTPACPYGPYLLEEIKHKLTTQLKLSRVDIDLVFDPPWQPSDEVKMLLGMA